VHQSSAIGKNERHQRAKKMSATRPNGGYLQGKRRACPMSKAINTNTPKSSDFYAGFQQAMHDYEQKYQKQTVPIDEQQLSLIFVRVVYYEDHTDAWKTGYFAGLFARLYSVLCGWTVSYHWTPGEGVSDVSYSIDCVRRMV
jgi:hypothetical protein